MARNEARVKANRDRPSGFHPNKNIDYNSPEAVKACRQLGLSDDIGLGEWHYQSQIKYLKT